MELPGWFVSLAV